MADPKPVVPESPPGEPDPPWLDRPSTHLRLFQGLGLVCAGLVVWDLLFHQHGHLEYEEWTGFHAAFGFFAYVAIVTSAKGLRRLVMRRENYYDR